MTDRRSLTIVGVFPVAEIRTGGHKRYVELAQQLIERGHRVVHICRPGMAGSLPGETIPVIPDHVQSYLIPRWWRYRALVNQREALIRDVVRDRGSANPDLVLTFGETNYPAARAVADQFSVPLVFALRSNFVDEFLQFGTFRQRIPGFRRGQKRFQRWWKQRLERMFCHGSDLIVFQTDYDRDNVITRNPEIVQKSAVIPNSFRVSWLPGELGRPVTCHSETDDHSGTNALAHRQPFQLVYLGHLNERKGVQYLFPALQILKDRGLTGFHLEVVGFGGLETWARTYVNDNGLDPFVTFHGRIDDPLSHVAAADLMVIPSLYDSFPNTVLEALFVGTPVIGADSAGISTMLHFPQLLFPRADSEALADRLQHVLQDPAAFREICRLSADRRVTFDFDWAERWEVAFDDACAVRGIRRVDDRDC